MSNQAFATLAGHVVLVTRGGRGLGPQLAHGLAAPGAAVVVTARHAAEVAATAACITTAGGQALALATEVTDRTAVERVVEELERRICAVDVLVNTAARFPAQGPVWEVDPDVWWRDVDVNLHVDRSSVRGLSCPA